MSDSEEDDDVILPQIKEEQPDEDDFPLPVAKQRRLNST